MLGRARVSTVEAMVRDLGAQDARVRVAAADAASAVVTEGDTAGRSRVVGALSGALRDGDANVRAAAALALADLAANEALPALLVAADDDAPLVRQLAITALGEIGDRRAGERIRRALRDDRPEVRFQAVVAFPRLVRGEDGVLADEWRDDAWAALGAGLDDSDGQVRGRAAEACAELADGTPLPKEVADRLAAMIARADESTEARVAAAIALAESGDRRGAATLLALMRGDIVDPDPGRVQAAFELAGELGLDGARELASRAAFGLRARLADPGRRAAALTALVRLRDPRAIALVLADLGGGSFARRSLAIGIAGRGALVDARPHLERLRADPQRADPDALEDALARIDGTHRGVDGS